MTVEEAYKLLGLKRSATSREAKASFRRLAKKIHPDACKDSNATQQFQLLNAAYEIVLEFLGETNQGAKNDLDGDLTWFAGQKKPRYVSADQDPFEIRHFDYWMPKIKKMLENLKKQ